MAIKEIESMVLKTMYFVAVYSTLKKFNYLEFSVCGATLESDTYSSTYHLKLAILPL